MPSIEFKEENGYDMPPLATPQSFGDIRHLPVAKPLDDAVWQAWVLNGRVREEMILAALYSPVAPVLSFLRERRRALLVASTVPSVVSLTCRNAKLVPNE